MAFMKRELVGGFGNVKRSPIAQKRNIARMEGVLNSKRRAIPNMAGAMRGAPMGGPPFTFDHGIMQIPRPDVSPIGRAEAMDQGNAAGTLPFGAGDEYGPDAIGNGMIRPYSAPSAPPVQPTWEGRMPGQTINPAVLALLREMIQRHQSGGFKPQGRTFNGGMF